MSSSASASCPPACAIWSSTRAESSMSDAERIQAFIQLAEEELAAARLLSSVAPRQAAYFLQQAAEKATRALLTDAGVPFGIGHNLGQMAKALPEAHPLRDLVARLDRHSVAATK